MSHIVDTALAKRAAEGNPVKVALIGAGFMAKGLVRQLECYTEGMMISVIANRTTSKAVTAFVEDGEVDASMVEEGKTVEEVNAIIASGKRAVTSSFEAAVGAEVVEVVLEVTGDVEYGSLVALKAFECKKHIVAMNAELDGTLGPLLKKKADEAGVIFSNSDGDQPGVIINLWRWVKSIGLKPIQCGNIKGFHNVRRNPTTQAEFAAATKQNPRMVTSFCDGTKVSFEMAVVANATGQICSRREMEGPDLDDHIDEAYKLFDLEEAKKEDHPGFVDYVVMKKPNKPPGGIYVLGYLDDPKQAHYFKYYKMGDGPIYTFYTPYHLCHFEVGLSCARAVLFHDAVCTAMDGPKVDVITKAKKDLKAGEKLDGIGGYLTYGVAENSVETRAENHLPMGLSDGCVLKVDVVMDQLITFDDVELPRGRVCDELWREQDAMFFSASK